MNSWKPAAWCAFAIYVGISWIAPEFYPFSTFPMYAGGAHFPVDRLLVVDARGMSVGREKSVEYRCVSSSGGALDLETALAASSRDGAFHVPYLDAEVREAIRWESSLTAEDLPWALVHRRFLGPSEGRLDHRDRVLAKCVGGGHD